MHTSLIALFGSVCVKSAKDHEDIIYYTKSTGMLSTQTC